MDLKRNNNWVIFNITDTELMAIADAIGSCSLEEKRILTPLKKLIENERQN